MSLILYGEGRTVTLESNNSFWIMLLFSVFFWRLGRGCEVPSIMYFYYKVGILLPYLITVPISGFSTYRPTDVV